MATKSANQGLPQGFKLPFKAVIPQQTRHDDVLACIATLTGNTLDEVWKVAVSQNWLPASGQYWVSEQLIASLFQQLGGLRSSVWKDFVSFDALSNVALLWVDPHKSDPENTGRTIIFHHVPAVADQYVAQVSRRRDPQEFLAGCKGATCGCRQLRQGVSCEATAWPDDCQVRF